MGLKFVKELVLLNEQVVPARAKDSGKKLSPLQDRLLQKLGAQAHPFTFQLPTTAPASVVLQDGGKDDTGPAVGVEYDFNTYVGENAEDRSHKRSSVSMAIRKVGPCLVRHP